MKKKLSVLAIALCAITTVQAQEATPVSVPVPSTLTRAEVLQDLAAWKAADLAEDRRGELSPDTSSSTYLAKLMVYQQRWADLRETPVSVPVPSTLTRAEVQQDFAAWRAAGLAQEWQGQLTPNTSSSMYTVKQKVYQQLSAQMKAQRHIATK